jgi:hypothetical protein
MGNWLASVDGDHVFGAQDRDRARDRFEIVQQMSGLEAEILRQRLFIENPG